MGVLGVHYRLPRQPCVRTHPRLAGHEAGERGRVLPRQPRRPPGEYPPGKGAGMEALPSLRRPDEEQEGRRVHRSLHLLQFPM